AERRGPAQRQDKWRRRGISRAQCRRAIPFGTRQSDQSGLAPALWTPAGIATPLKNLRKEKAQMTDARKKILDTVDANKEKAIKFLQDIVAIPSVTGDEGKIQAFLNTYLKKVGLDVDMWESKWEELKKHPGYIPVERGYEGRPNIVATWKGSGGGRSLLLNGHTDVIPVGNGEGWSDNPWSAKVKEGRIYGRGSCDMKSGVASHILAVELLKAAGIKLKGDVLINIVIDEEVSG